MEIRKAGSMEKDRIALPDKDLTAGIICTAIPVHKALYEGHITDSGLLFNFAAMVLTIKRVVREHNQPS